MSDASASRVECVCGASLKDQKRLKQHLKRTCKGPASQNSILMFSDCDKSYTKLQSLNQHRRLAHPTQYNIQLEKEAVGARRRWSNAEIQKLAQLESNYNGTGSLNAFLSKAIGRTEESIKGRRKQASYKAILAELSATKQTASLSNTRSSFRTTRLNNVSFPIKSPENPSNSSSTHNLLDNVQNISNSNILPSKESLSVCSDADGY